MVCFPLEYVNMLVLLFGNHGCHVDAYFFEKYMGGSLNGGTPKTPQNNHFW